MSDQPALGEGTALPDLQRLADQIDGLPHCRAMHMRVEAIERDWARMVLPGGPHLQGARAGEMHGGAVMTLADTVCGLVAFTDLPVGTPVATLDLRVDTLSPAEAATDLLAEARCTHRTHRLTTVQGELLQQPAIQGGERQLIAAVVATFMTGAVGFAV
ncbi:MAG: PaaI family thioesterase [Alphaproteobacteria bacterium]|nr:PaaI family thioesterase [Alphaproteobacteria bacterium]